MRRVVKVKRGWTWEAELYFAGYCMKYGKLLMAQDPQTIYFGISKALLAFSFLVQFKQEVHRVESVNVSLLYSDLFFSLILELASSKTGSSGRGAMTAALCTLTLQSSEASKKSRYRHLNCSCCNTGLRVYKWSDITNQNAM